MNTLQSWRFYLRYATRSLWREGMRSVLAGLSIAFGVASIVAMQTLSGVLHNTMFDEQLRYGGDAEIHSQQTGKALRQSELEQIEMWRTQGLIRRYSPIASGSARYLRTPASGRVTFLGNAVGIDPAIYPLVGELVLREPVQQPPATLLRQPTDVLITRDLADKLGLRIGDPLLLGGGDVTPVKLTVAGVVQATPDRKGSTLFYTLKTAQLLEARADVVTSVSVQWGDVANAAQTIRASQFGVSIARTPEELVNASAGATIFDAMLKGAGVLGLLVGGLGVSNTLQVILARRKLEIAVLKTLGYRQFRLLWLIGLEMGLLGLVSSTIGAGAGAALGGRLVDLLGSEGALLDSSPNLGVMLGGILIGVATAVVFGLQAILALSATRPVEILRDQPLKPTRAILVARMALFAGLFVILGGLVGWLLGSILQGIAYVVGGGLLLMGLRAIFQWILWAILNVPISQLRFPVMPMLKMARANLNQRKAQASLILLALCAGVFSITLAALVINTAQARLSEQRAADEGYNLMIYTTVEDVSQITEHLLAQKPRATYTRYQTDGTLDGEPIMIEGRTATDLGADLKVDRAWKAAENSALLPATYAQSYQVGEMVTLKANAIADSQAVNIKIFGFYTPVGDYNTNLSGVPTGVIVSPQTAITLSGGQIQVSVIASFLVERLDEATNALGLALPDALVFSKVDLTNQIIASYRTLFAFVVSVAGLAGVAGAVLIANAAGLAVVERRREIGVFKAIGYSSRQVLRILVGEYAFLGVLAGLAGLLAVVVVILYINHTYPSSNIVIEPRIAGVMFLLSSAVAIISATLVAWQPTRVRPLDVLRYE